MTLMPAFRLRRPVDLADAVAALAETPGGRPLAGGTDLLVNLRRGMDDPPALVDLTGVAGLDRLVIDETGLRIGATVTLARIAEDATIAARWPALAQAAVAVAGPTHREAATLAGNLCQETRCVFVNQSDWWRAGNGFCLKVDGDACHIVKRSERCYAVYAGDVAPALIALRAEVEIAGPDGTRRVPLADFFRDEGRTHVGLAPSEIVAAVHVPPPDGSLTGYVKMRIRDSIDFPIAGIAAAVSRDGDRLAALRVAVTGIASAPLMVPGLDALIGKPWPEVDPELLAGAVRRLCFAAKTTVVSPNYRRRVAGAGAVRLVGDLWAAAGLAAGSREAAR